MFLELLVLGTHDLGTETSEHGIEVIVQLIVVVGLEFDDGVGAKFVGAFDQRRVYIFLKRLSNSLANVKSLLFVTFVQFLEAGSAVVNSLSYLLYSIDLLS